MLQDEVEININTWFGEREVKTNVPPKHFIKSSVTLTRAGEDWISEKCQGRYWVQNFSIYFEDPRELMMYELAYG